MNEVADMYAAPPLELKRTAGRIQLRYTERGFMAAVTDRRCTSSDSSSSAGERKNQYRYAVQEVQQLANGKWEYLEGGRVLTWAEGTGVWEWNDNPVAVGTVVWVEPFLDQDWRFEHCCPSALSCSSSSSSASSRSSSSQSLSSVSSSSTSSVSSSSTSSRSSGSSSSGSSSSGSSSSSRSSSSTSSSSVSSSSASSVSSSSQSTSSRSDSSTSNSSISDSGSSDSSDSCNGTVLEFITDLAFDTESCTLTVTKKRVCLPACINVVVN